MNRSTHDLLLPLLTDTGSVKLNALFELLQPQLQAFPVCDSTYAQPRFDCFIMKVIFFEQSYPTILL